MKDPNHPIWPIIRMTIILVVLAVVLWMNASHFDDTELRTVLTMFFALLGVEGFAKFAAAKHPPASA